MDIVRGEPPPRELCEESDGSTLIDSSPSKIAQVDSGTCRFKNAVMRYKEGEEVRYRKIFFRWSIVMIYLLGT